ncbi:MAG: hypothetical protein Q4G45_07455 [Actinomycetia bacterium]|nr:hypothetical protein [Actinomycetes bacterium]
MTRALVAVLALVLLAACTGGSGPSPSMTVSGPAAVSPYPGSSGPVRTEPVGSPVPSPSTAPYASRDLARTGGTVSMAVYPLRRDGTLMWLTAHVTVTTSGEWVEVHGLWGPPLHEHRWRLVDQAGKLAYLPATVDGKPVCSPSIPLRMGRGDELWISCAFGAPPESVTTVSVHTESFGVYESVPIR